MRPEELMIGDYVTFSDCQNGEKPTIIKIWSINQDGDAFVFIDDEEAVDEIVIDDEIVGLPLTPEILEKNEFIKENTWSGIFTMKYCFYEEGGIKYEELNFDKKIAIEVEFSASDNHIRHINIDCFTDKGCAKINLCNKEGMFYVHEFQRALRLCNINKEIIL